MLTTPYLLALDAGTTSTRALLFRADLSLVAVEQIEIPQHYPAPGWVEHEPGDLWSTAVAALRGVLAGAGVGAGEVAALGVTNQRETTLLWDRATGEPLHRAIVWQDRRTADLCAELRAAGHEPEVAARTGLLLDPYFSGTKLAWLLDRVPGARARAEAGELAFGTVDSFLLWRLTGGRVHATDATNASRTLLYNLRAGAWDEAMLRLFRIPRPLLPEVRDTAGEFGATDPALLGGAVAMRALVGDQQSALAGQACFAPGMVKSTFGTGAFALLHTGAEPVPSRHRLLTTVALQLRGRRTYALEGSIFVAGAAVQWLRDGLGLIAAASESGPLAETADEAQDVVLVPAFTGLGAPHWRPDARGALFGLTRATGPAELARAALESVAFQTHDLLEAMAADRGGAGATALRVDGGLSASDWAMGRLADVLGAPVDRPALTETTALGAAYLAGLAAGLCPEPEAFAAGWRAARRFAPAMDAPARARRLGLWRDALRRVLG